MCTANTLAHPVTNNEKYFLYANFFSYPLVEFVSLDVIYISFVLHRARKELKRLVCRGSGSGSGNSGGTSLYLAKFDRLEFIYLFMGNIKIATHD